MNNETYVFLLALALGGVSFALGACFGMFFCFSTGITSSKQLKEYLEEEEDA